MPDNETKEKMYNFLARELIGQTNFTNEEDYHINLFIDKRKDLKEIRKFNDYIEIHLNVNTSFQSKVNCYHEDSKVIKVLKS